MRDGAAVLNCAMASSRIADDTRATRRDPGEASAPHGPTGELVTWVHRLQWEEIPEDTRARANDLILDGVGCALVGAQLPWSRLALDGVLALEGVGDTVVIGTGRTTTAAGSALLNSSFIQGFELDDFHPLAPLHSVSVILPSLLATASQIEASTGRTVTGHDLMLASIVGFEVGPRIGYALGGSEMLSRGWHSGPIFGGIAAALACGKLRGLNPAQLEDAVGFAATQAAGLMSAQYESMGKRMQHGFAARNGYYAAGLAEAGYTGIDQVLEREYGGFLAVYGEGHQTDPHAITRGLGENWETNFIMVKSWAVMGGLHGAVEAAQFLRARLGAEGVANIARLDIRVGDVIYHHGWWEPQRPLTAIGAQMNIGYATAVTLLDGTALPEQFTSERLDADDVWRILNRTSVELDPGIDELVLTERFQTHLRVTLGDGRVETSSIIHPHGNPFDPITSDEVAEKFHALVARVMNVDRANAIADAVAALATSATVTDLTGLLADSVGRALD